MQKGGTLFRTSCSACHTVGGGDFIGPDLAGVTRVRERAWLVRFISQPDKVLAEKDPIATALFNRYNRINMPNLSLKEKDVDSLLTFIESMSHHAQHEGAESGGAGR
jgi:protein SCO1/2